jgi:2-succinyl-5-enolpyruvyl-6-hydroxy-3-cyclohexene-1-carboxylate synthase
MKGPTNPATVLARAVVTRLLEAGVSEIVIAPGSRNAPLSFAAYDAAAAGLVRLHTRIDERSAGFLALGLTRNGNRAAVICTSGTAVANLHPAVLEALHTGLRVVFVTADRPRRLLGTTANQTTDQIRLFGDHLEFIDLSAPDRKLAEHLTVAGPLHVNVRLDEPLLPLSRWKPRVTLTPPSAGLGVPTYTQIPLGPRTVVVAGDDSRQGARRLAEAAGWPLLAEPSSGSRTGERALRCYRLLLDGELGQRIQRVVVYGRPTLSRPVTRLLGREDVEVLSVPAPGFFTKRPFVSEVITGGIGVEGLDDPEWLTAWLDADRSVARQLDRLLAEEPDLTPHEVAGAVGAALPPGGLLVVGASSPIRDLDLMARPYDVGSKRKVVANRGLAGIDGTVSTAIGAALARRPEDRALALMGDVTFLHDSNGLVLGPDEPRPDLMIVVVNDDGGSIFSMLEQGGPDYADGFERLFSTPHGVDLAALCAATRTPHLRVTSLPELEQVLASPNGGIEVVEAVVRRDTRRSLDERIRALVP